MQSKFRPKSLILLLIKFETFNYSVSWFVLFYDSQKKILVENIFLPFEILIWMYSEVTWNKFSPISFCKANILDYNYWGEVKD